MVDFRYHLVSLIAVFLALALGILLGAGPLNETIGDQLTDQVADLREDSDRLRTELEVSQMETDTRDQFIDAMAPSALGSRLEGRTVAVVSLPGANADDVADIGNRLDQAGAVVSGHVEVTDEWTDPGSAAFRSSFAGQILGYLDPVPDDGADTGVILGAALGQALTRGDEEGVPTADAETLLELLASADAPLVEVVEEPTAAANATVLVAPRPEDPAPQASESGTDVAAQEQRLTEHVALAHGLADTAEGAVVVGSAATELDLVSAIRADSQAVETVTTIDSVSDVTGRLSVPLALAVTISGVVDHYGIGPGAEAPVPPSVYLPPPAPPEPEPADGPAGTGEDATDGATDEDATAGADAEATEDAEAVDAEAVEPETADAG